MDARLVDEKARVSYVTNDIAKAGRDGRAMEVLLTAWATFLLDQSFGAVVTDDLELDYSNGIAHVSPGEEGIFSYGNVFPGGHPSHGLHSMQVGKQECRTSVYSTESPHVSWSRRCLTNAATRVRSINESKRRDNKKREERNDSRGERGKNKSIVAKDK